MKTLQELSIKDINTGEESNVIEFVIYEDGNIDVNLISEKTENVKGNEK